MDKQETRVKKIFDLTVVIEGGGGYRAGKESLRYSTSRYEVGRR